MGIATQADIEHGLRPRQLRFARLVASGIIPAHAYPLAGYNPNKRKCLDAAASRLLACVRIKRAIAYYRDRELESSILTITQRKHRLSEIATEDIPGRHGPQREPSISAIRELNRMERVGADPTTPAQIQIVIVHDSQDRLRQVQAIDGEVCLLPEPEDRQSDPDNQPQP